MNKLNDVYYLDDTYCIKNARVFGLEDSIRGAKFPMSVNADELTTELTPGILKLATSEPGAGHDNWLNGVVVQFDLTFSAKAMIELERYHFLDFVSSTSTMHRITKFDQENIYNQYVDRRIVQIMEEKVAAYNTYCEDHKDIKDEMAESTKRAMYLEILYSNPNGFLYTARMTTNYRQLKTIYRQRKNHRLPEWREFCRWIEQLPHSELITGVVE